MYNCTIVILLLVMKMLVKESSVDDETIEFEIESIEDIDNKEIEGYKNCIKSKLTGIDYETYIKQFWVGLLEGDGTITVSTPGPEQVKVLETIGRYSDAPASPGISSMGRKGMIIAIKNLRENVMMLLLIQQVIGGTVRIERKAQYVTWIAIRKGLIQTLIGILKKYPLLTTRKQCQLKFAERSIKEGTKEFVEKNRDLMYKDQSDMLNYNEKNFVIPSYFPAWLSGFVEAEGSFIIWFDKRRDNEVRLRFYLAQNIEHYLIKAIRDYLGGKVKVVARVFNKEFSEKRIRLGEVVHYSISMENKEVISNIINHFSRYPLLGDKRVSYKCWCDYFSNN